MLGLAEQRVEKLLAKFAADRTVRRALSWCQPWRVGVGQHAHAGYQVALEELWFQRADDTSPCGMAAALP